MNKILERLKNKLIVSCQSEEGDPFNSPEYVTLFAKAAIMGGATGIRSEGFFKTKMIVENVDVPVIGLIKSHYEDGFVRITGSFADVEKLIETKCHIIAVDGTFRLREGVTGPNFIKEIKKRYNVLVMADISTYEEGIACAKSGADCISTTLSGYTPETKHLSKDKPDIKLVSDLTKNISIPVIAEGKLNKPEYAAEALKAGAWACVVGTAITRPRIITQWYIDAINNVKEN
ncbi:MAG TPA: N-acetylmannosamine-6-phosphate 2-epimerase [Ignavibacteriaceae bacterium]|nr:N-acetylmannosamine-6-phosphate 2-epimerase [Ignavibacteriaceae bacterium]